VPELLQNGVAGSSGGVSLKPESRIGGRSELILRHSRHRFYDFDQAASVRRRFCPSSGSPECSGLPPGSGKSESADFNSGSWSRCPSWPCIEVLSDGSLSSCSTAPFERS
jgi:hypothetical protein